MFGFQDVWISGCLDFRMFGFQDVWIFWFFKGSRIVGLKDFWIQDFRMFGFSVFFNGREDLVLIWIFWFFRIWLSLFADTKM